MNKLCWNYPRGRCKGYGDSGYDDSGYGDIDNGDNDSGFGDNDSGYGDDDSGFVGHTLSMQGGWRFHSVASAF